MGKLKLEIIDLHNESEQVEIWDGRDEKDGKPVDVPERKYGIKKVKRGKIEKDSKQLENPGSETTQPLNKYKYITPLYDFAILSDFYEDSSWNFRCINIKAQVVAGLGFFYQSIDGKLEETNPAEVVKIAQFVSFCNLQGESLIDVLTRFWIDYETFGQGYLEVVRNFSGELEEIYHVPAQNMRITADKKQFLQLKTGTSQYKVFTAFGGERTDEAPTEILTMRSYNPSSSYYGLPDYIPALLAIQMDNLAGEYNSAFFDNNAIPAMAVITEGGSLDKESKKAVKSFFQNAIKGTGNAHKTIYIPTTGTTKVKFEKLESDKKDYSFRNLRWDNRDEIISAHGTPPRLLGILTAGQLGGTSEGFSQMVTFRELVSSPRTRRLEGLMNRLFKYAFGITGTILKFNQLNLQSESERNQDMMDMTDRNIITRTEARNEAGFSGEAPDEATKLGELIDKMEKLKLTNRS